MSEVFNFTKLHRAYLACRKTKRGTANALKFEMDQESKLFKLLHELKTRKYAPGRSICFVVENPTIREIFAADFRDRIVHHLLVNELEKIGEKMFIFDSFACRKKKGTHLAVERLRSKIRKITKNHKRKAWFMQLDISGFFMSIDHKILYSILEKIVSGQNKSQEWKEDVLWLGKVLIFHKPTENYVKKGDELLFAMVPTRKSLFSVVGKKGLPIGNYSSQFCANIFMNQLDQFVKRKLKCAHYVRYVDDFIILAENKMELQHKKSEIEDFLRKNLGMKLNHKKTKICKLEQGIDFLGYFMKPSYTLVRRRVVKKMRMRIGLILAKYVKTKNTKEILETVNSYFGHFAWAASYNLRKNIFENNFGMMQEVFATTEKFEKIGLKIV